MNPLKRRYHLSLTAWFESKHRKPLVIRGARQVGKSTLVREFARQQGLHLAEINLERYRTLNPVFASLDSHRILRELEGVMASPIRERETLLFLDEIQATPDALAALRYLHEDRPNLAVIAAGSLLEFCLADHYFSMPVGRIDYLHVGPMTFKEFLQALGEDYLVQSLETYEWGDAWPQSAHDKLLERERQYLFIGGMPEAVLRYVESGSIEEARRVHRSIVQTYIDDFAKYAKHNELVRVQQIFERVPGMVGRKVKYSEIRREDRAALVKSAIDLLIKARLVLPVFHSDCSGLPIKAGINDKIYKLYCLDVGVLNYLLGLEWSVIAGRSERDLVNEGALAEQVIAQHMAYANQGLEPPELFYWLREGKGTNAELDFVWAKLGQIIPIEVKAGSSGRLRSLQQFVFYKHSARAVRFDLNPPSRQRVTHQVRIGSDYTPVSFELFALPLYMVEELSRLLENFKRPF